MSQGGSVWAGLLGLQVARFDRLEVYDPVLGVYINVADVLEQLESEIENL